MRYSRGRRRSQYLRRRKKWNFVPLLTVLVLIVLFVWTGKLLISALFSSVRSESASAEIQILSGRAGFSLPETEEFSPAFSAQKFLTGDTIKTFANSRISLELPGGNFIFLGSNSEIEFTELEQKSSGKKTIKIKLNSGRVWARISDDDFSKDSDSKFEMETDRSRLYVRGTAFAYSTNEGQDVVRLIKGTVDVDIFDGEDVENVEVGVGQKLVVNGENLENLKNNIDILEIIDTEFIESEWHLKNFERFFPAEAAEIRRRIEISAPKVEPKTENSNLEESTDMESPQILSPQNGATISAGVDSIKIEGIAPANAVQVIVNGYTLT
ncbi:MAG: FecR domain-containing protein, partial [Candidatus Peregrinibacteria bacterium]|nr:FecR domain-containing protein [Candidatus Peregrinibacteria bacterium]